MDNRIIAISTVYNKRKWIGYNISSIKQQSYTNFLAVYGYDSSNDDTLQEMHKHIDGDARFWIIDNKGEKNQIGNFLNVYDTLKGLNQISAEDIIVEVDADDWLLHPFVFNHLNEAYQDPNAWMTYGHYVQYPTGTVGGHFFMHLPDSDIRQQPFAYSHLKTYKAWLFDKVPRDYLIDPRTGKYWKTTADFAMCMPMVEMAGKNRIVRFDDPTYVYNVSDDLQSESQSNLREQKEAERLIRQLKPLTRL